MQTAADLNAAADLMATLYTHSVMLTSEALDLSNVAPGGSPLPRTYTAGGAAGPLEEHAAIDGIAWSTVCDFTLTGVATHVGQMRAGVVHNTEKLPSPVGPGSVPYVHGIGPSAL